MPQRLAFEHRLLEIVKEPFSFKHERTPQNVYGLRGSNTVISVLSLLVLPF